MGAYNPNKGLIEDANKAAACGMSYGKWREKGCPEPTKGAKPKADISAGVLLSSTPEKSSGNNRKE